MIDIRTQALLDEMDRMQGDVTNRTFKKFASQLRQAIEAEARSTPAEALDPPLVVSHLRRLTDAARAILAADSPDHTITPTDDQWGELDAATDEASAYLESGRGFDD